MRIATVLAEKALNSTKNSFYLLTVHETLLHRKNCVYTCLNALANGHFANGCFANGRFANGRFANGHLVSDDWGNKLVLRNWISLSSKPVHVYSIYYRMLLQKIVASFSRNANWLALCTYEVLEIVIRLLSNGISFGWNITDPPTTWCQKCTWAFAVFENVAAVKLKLISWFWRVVDASERGSFIIITDEMVFETFLKWFTDLTVVWG